MSNRLGDAISPYLRSHAENPVDWFAWGADAFAEAAARDVPVLVSIGYSTCHWCHVMARESFSDPEIASQLNDGFVSIKVDREEHPEVDATYLAAAGAFTEQLGWPLNVFVTPHGKAFYAGTYWPPSAMSGHPSFRQVLDAVSDAWTTRRDEVLSNADAVADAITRRPTESGDPRPADFGGIDFGGIDFGGIVAELVGHEDREHGGFGGAPKFPVAPVVRFLLDQGSLGSSDAAALADRTLRAMAASDLRDPVEGGFFRYATRRDWTDPHYERMLYDNSMLLAAYSRIEGGEEVAAGIASFLRDVLRVGGAFASAQDSESILDGARNEGGYYSLDAAGRAGQSAPALDRKVLTGWNGLAIEALADAGFRLGRPEWIDLARTVADTLVATHLRSDGSLVRASVDGRASVAVATLEDYGMLASALLRLALVTGDARYADAGRALVDACMSGSVAHTGAVFVAPGGADPVLVGQGLALDGDPSEGAYPSGLSAIAAAAHTLHLLTGDRAYADAAARAMGDVASLAAARPIAFGAALSVMSALAAPIVQLVVVGVPDADVDEDVVALVRRWDRAGGVVAKLNSEQAGRFAASGFELFEGRTPIDGRAAAYFCRDFVCRLPVTDARALHELLSDE